MSQQETRLKQISSPAKPRIVDVPRKHRGFRFHPTAQLTHTEPINLARNEGLSVVSRLDHVFSHSV
jgi:hypothetical protein